MSFLLFVFVIYISKVIKFKEEKKMFSKFDTVKGRVICSTKKGSYVECDGVNAFLNRYSLKEGTEVICSVIAVKPDGFAILGLDSVVYAA